MPICDFFFPEWDFSWDNSLILVRHHTSGTFLCPGITQWVISARILAILTVSLFDWLWGRNEIFLFLSNCHNISERKIQILCFLGMAEMLLCLALIITIAMSGSPSSCQKFMQWLTVAMNSCGKKFIPALVQCSRLYCLLPPFPPTLFFFNASTVFSYTDSYLQQDFDTYNFHLSAAWRLWPTCFRPWVMRSQPFLFMERFLKRQFPKAVSTGRTELVLQPCAFPGIRERVSQHSGWGCVEHRAYAEPSFFWSLPCPPAMALSATNVPQVFKRCHFIVTFPGDPLSLSRCHFISVDFSSSAEDWFFSQQDRISADGNTELPLTPV